MENIEEDKRDLIILIDDNLTNLKIGKNILGEKYAVATAPSAEKLFNILEHNYPAMILLDIDMPEMNGYEVIKILKSKPQTCDIPVIFLTSKTESDDELTGLTLGAIDYITKPFQPALLLKRIEVHLLVEVQQKTLKKQTAMLKQFSDNLQKMVDEKTQDVLNLQDALLKTIAELVECRDDITGGHIERTQLLIKIILEEISKLDMYREEIKDWDINLLLQSCQLHDVGKISISDNILKKCESLTAEEFEEMKKHVRFGEEIIERIEELTEKSHFLNYAKIFVSSHHEKWNGSGYYRGLKGNEIPLLGRIMAIADVYDALISERPYKKSFSHEEACKIIEDNAGIHFDPILVDVFRKIKDRLTQ